MLDRVGDTPNVAARMQAHELAEAAGSFRDVLQQTKVSRAGRLTGNPLFPR